MSFPLTHRPRSYSMTHINHAQALSADSECAQPCMHHPIAPQYPNGNAVKDLADLSEFVKTVAEGLERIAFPRPQQKYSSVYVLMISWEDDDLGTAREIGALQNIFEKDYRYLTRHYEIPSYKKIPPGSEPSWELEEVLIQTRNQHGRSEDGLLIIYYGGHGEVSKKSQHSIWKAWKSQPIGDRVPPTSPEIDWSSSQAMIMGAKAEILFILDCCYASASVRDFGQRYKGRRELLLASGNDKASNENTLTKALVHELLDLHASPCTVSSLHARILENQSTHNLKPAPIYTCMVGAKAGIVLAPLPDPNAPTSSTPQETVIPHADRKILFSPCRVLISVSLTEIGGQSIRETWMEWFRDHAPPNVGAVDFFRFDATEVIQPAATFDSNSSYVIFSIPVSVWNVMDPNPAINLLSIVRSNNRIHRHRSIFSVFPNLYTELEDEIGKLEYQISTLDTELYHLKDSNATLSAENSKLRLAAAQNQSRRSPSPTKTTTPAKREDASLSPPLSFRPRGTSPPNPAQAHKVEDPLRRGQTSWLSKLQTDDKHSRPGWVWAPPPEFARNPFHSVSDDSVERLALRGTLPAKNEPFDPVNKPQKPVIGRYEQPEAGGAGFKRGVGEERSWEDWDDGFVPQEIWGSFSDEERQSSGEAKNQQGVVGEQTALQERDDDVASQDTRSRAKLLKMLLEGEETEG